MSARFYIGDTRSVTCGFADNSVDLVVTSPPFLGLRDYLPDVDELKALEIGREPNPETFLDTLLGLTAEWGRVLAPHGSICVELGDTYRSARTKSTDGWPQPKSLCVLPGLYAASLAYGRNLLNGVESPAGEWILRNMLVWSRPNPSPGALGDKFRPSTSTIVVATRSPNRWFDMEAVRTNPRAVKDRYERSSNRKVRSTGATQVLGSNYQTRVPSHPAGAPPTDWHDDRDAERWEPFLGMPTGTYRGAHSATFPLTLPEKIVAAMCPLRVCVECGEPSRRVTQNTDKYQKQRDAIGDFVSDKADGLNRTVQYVDGVHITAAEKVTVGWTDCGCGAAWRRGVVFDPFAGTGTTLAAAEGLGRDSVGIDLDRRNVDLARRRVGMFLEDMSA